MSRAVIKFKLNNEIYNVNICADKMQYDNLHLIICRGENIVGVFAWDTIISAYISERTEK